MASPNTTVPVLPLVSIVKFLFVVPSEITLSLKVTLLSVVVKVTLVLKVVTPSYCWVQLVVTFAPRLEVVDTDNELAFVIAASKSSAPVILITPRPYVPPTAPSNSVSVNTVDKLSVSDALSVLELLTVPPNVNCAPPVKVMSAETVVLPV